MLSITGDNVWIGAGVQVMPGVTIGSNVVIGRQCVVKDIPDNSVAVGNPCKVIERLQMKIRKIVGIDSSFIDALMLIYFVQILECTTIETYYYQHEITVFYLKIVENN